MDVLHRILGTALFSPSDRMADEFLELATRPARERAIPPFIPDFKRMPQAVLDDGGQFRFLRGGQAMAQPQPSRDGVAVSLDKLKLLYSKSLSPVVVADRRP